MLWKKIKFKRVRSRIAGGVVGNLIKFLIYLLAQSRSWGQLKKGKIYL
jgi:hypothetical protein